MEGLGMVVTGHGGDWTSRQADTRAGGAGLVRTCSAAVPTNQRTRAFAFFPCTAAAAAAVAAAMTPA